MNRSTGCIVCPGLWLKGAIFQPVLQDGTRNLSWAFLAWAWAGFKGGMSIMSSEVFPSMQNVTQQAGLPTAMQSQQKSWEVGNWEVLSGSQGVAPGASHSSRAASQSVGRCEHQNGCAQPRERGRAAVQGTIAPDR